MFHSAILKVISVCNLDCTYCYVFNLRDQSFQRTPPRMPDEVAIAFADRLREYIGTHGIRTFTVVLHGGEPTLWPTDSYVSLLGALSQASHETGCDIRVSVQTNAYKPLDPALLELLHQYGATLGVSIDGPKPYHDSVRVTIDGSGSYDSVVSTVEDIVAQGYLDVLGGFLSVANPSIPPDAYLDWVASLPLSRVDVLWPMDYNLEHPPWSEGNRALYAHRPAFGAWFADLFEEWMERDDPSLDIRLFRDIIKHFLGSPSHVDSIVNDQMDMFVVESDGTMSYPDYLRVAEDGLHQTGLTLINDDIDSLHDLPVFDRLFNLASFLPAPCYECPHRGVCGGGFLPGRTRSSAPLIIEEEPSIMCTDQYHFFARVKSALAANGLAV